MDLARYLVDAVVVEGRSYRDVAKAHGVSKSLVAKLVARFRSGGYEAIAPRSRAPRRTPHRTSAEVEDRIVVLRKRLDEDGLDAGAQTIHHHLSLELARPPSVSTIWRVLRRRGFVTPQPHKRPRSSWIRFEARLPNECWQSDVTTWTLDDGTPVDIVDVIDDHSRLALASVAVPTATAGGVLQVLRGCFERFGEPAAVLTDNGCVYTTWHRGGPNVVQTELLSRGIAFKHSRPNHPQTCGKVERFHQTLKIFLHRQPKADSIAMLQAQLDRFVAYYNEVRPHRARGRTTPRQAFDALAKARPSAVPIHLPRGVRVRSDRVAKAGKLTLRYRSRLYHIGVGRAHVGKRVVMLIDGLDVRIVALETGELLRAFTLDPSKAYQGTGKPQRVPKGTLCRPKPR